VPDSENWHWQVRFSPDDISHKTMKGMDRAAQLAMLPDYEIFCVDLTEGSFLSTLSY